MKTLGMKQGWDWYGKVERVGLTAKENAHLG